MNKIGRTNSVGKGAVVILLLIWLAGQIYPVVFLFSTSVKEKSEILNNPFSFASGIDFHNYINVIAGSAGGNPFLDYMTNSIVATVVGLLVLVSISSMAGYALARGKFPGSAFAQQLVLLSMAVPVHVLLVPTYLMFGQLGIKNSPLWLGILYAAHGFPFTTFLMRAYFVNFPKELEEAAQIDGCSRLGTFVRVVLPISLGPIASMAIVNVSWIWSELFFSQVLLDRSESRTLPAAIASLRPGAMTAGGGVGELFAAMAMTILPVIVFYAIFQRQIRSGVTAGAIK